MQARWTQQAHEQQQEKQRGHAWPIEQTFGHTDQEITTQRREQYREEQVTSPHRGSEPPKHRQDSKPEYQYANPALLEKDLHPKIEYVPR